MLNSKNERELAYIVKIDEIRSIENYDRVEYARVNGWWVIVQKNQFKVGDYAIYIEVDSRVPDIEQFDFLAKRKFKVKTLKMCGVVSQGLLMSLEDFPKLFEKDENVWFYKKDGLLVMIKDFLTKDLKITYANDEDIQRKAKEVSKYEKMYARHRELIKGNIFLKWLYSTSIGKKILFIFLGKKKDKQSWPAWVKKTDEERVQNLPYLFPGNNEHWIVTEKIDGSSSTYTIKRRLFNKYDFYVCSRNVCFDTPEKEEKCFYDTNIYLEIANKYNIEEVLKNLLEKETQYDFITLQGEIYGEGIQQRTYSLNEHKFMAFNLIFGYKNGETIRLNPNQMRNYLIKNKTDIPCVPIIEEMTLPSTCEEMLKYANGLSILDGQMREGVVLRTLDGKNSFKAVSNEYLLKYHS